jgi:hypothetical protein
VAVPGVSRDAPEGGSLVRRIVLALTMALVAGSLGAATAQADEPAGPLSQAKVVIIVGATHGATSQYRARADSAYAVARAYTENVVKVYSPNATWSAVRTAIQGANVVVYMGHGNGFPSPYRTTPWPYSQNGFGLNAVAGQGDDNNTYYGESYIAAEIRLAPNAVVLLHHLCYASGNSEPGFAEPTLAVAKQRVDNYAAGFLAAGAAAVIADGHAGPEAYLRGLFEQSTSLDRLWRGAPNFHGNAFAFPSSRTPGATAQMDPDAPSGGYYRAMTGDPEVRTSDVTGIRAVGGIDPRRVVAVDVPRP